MTGLELLNLLTVYAKRYAPGAHLSLTRNDHLNELRSMPGPIDFERVTEALLSDFINFIASARCIDYALHSRDLRTTQPSNLTAGVPAQKDFHMVRAKVKCASITDFGQNKAVALSAVTDDSPENKTWSKYTPNGEIRLTITNPDAFNQFEVGKEYFVDFNPVVVRA